MGATYIRAPRHLTPAKLSHMFAASGANAPHLLYYGADDESPEFAEITA